MLCPVKICTNFVLGQWMQRFAQSRSNAAQWGSVQMNSSKELLHLLIPEIPANDTEICSRSCSMKSQHGLWCGVALFNFYIWTPFFWPWGECTGRVDQSWLIRHDPEPCSCSKFWLWSPVPAQHRALSLPAVTGELLSALNLALLL